MEWRYFAVVEGFSVPTRIDSAWHPVGTCCNAASRACDEGVGTGSEPSSGLTSTGRCDAGAVVPYELPQGRRLRNEDGVTVGRGGCAAVQPMSLALVVHRPAGIAAHAFMLLRRLLHGRLSGCGVAAAQPLQRGSDPASELRFENSRRYSPKAAPVSPAAAPIQFARTPPAVPSTLRHSLWRNLSQRSSQGGSDAAAAPLSGRIRYRVHRSPGLGNLSQGPDKRCPPGAGKYLLRSVLSVLSHPASTGLGRAGFRTQKKVLKGGGWRPSSDWPSILYRPGLTPSAPWLAWWFGDSLTHGCHEQK